MTAGSRIYLVLENDLVRFSGAHHAAVFESQSSPGLLLLAIIKQSRGCNEPSLAFLYPAS
jgi:hypothetical protein